VANNLPLLKPNLAGAGKRISDRRVGVETRDRNFSSAKVWNYGRTTVLIHRDILSEADSRGIVMNAYRVPAICDLKRSVDFLTRPILIITLRGIKPNPLSEGRRKIANALTTELN
jgi:hypothetical protein